MPNLLFKPPHTFSSAQAYGTDHRIYHGNYIAAKFKRNAAAAVRVDASPIAGAFRFAVEFAIRFVVSRIPEFSPVGFAEYSPVRLAEFSPVRFTGYSPVRLAEYSTVWFAV